MAKLRGKEPQPTEQRLKLMLFSLAGVGKTTAALQMPKPYIIDTESGTIHYGELVTKSGGAVYPTTSMDEAIAEVRALMTTKHDYRTLVIDSFTPLYEEKMEEGVGKVGDSYGKHIAYADRYAKSLFRLLTLVDMNVVVTSHARDEWEGGEKKGIRFDGWKKLDYLFDLVLELDRRGKKRYAVVKKTRLAAFPDQDSFEWAFASLAERWGADKLEREAEQVPMATPERVADLERKVKALNIPSDETEKWLTKAGVETFAEMTADVIEKCISYCNKKLEEAGNNAAQATV